MPHSNTIPANVIPCLRAGSRAELDDASRELAAAEDRILKDRHSRALRESHREEPSWAGPIERLRAHRELLDLIGWTEENNMEAVEMDPDGHHLWAIRETLERFERDQPGVCAAEIQAFRLAVGLPS